MVLDSGRVIKPDLVGAPGPVISTLGHDQHPVPVRIQHFRDAGFHFGASHFDGACSAREPSTARRAAGGLQCWRNLRRGSAVLGVRRFAVLWPTDVQRQHCKLECRFCDEHGLDPRAGYTWPSRVPERLTHDRLSGSLS